MTAEILTMQNRGTSSADLHGILRKQAIIRSKQRGLSLSELATASIIEETRLSGILTGEADGVTLRELAGLSLALEIPLTALLSES
ncbi:MAG TPA: helix-turn-helix domain-containing protein [Burkholderiales bacterium]